MGWAAAATGLGRSHALALPVHSGRSGGTVAQAQAPTHQCGEGDECDGDAQPRERGRPVDDAHQQAHDHQYLEGTARTARTAHTRGSSVSGAGASDPRSQAWGAGGPAAAAPVHAVQPSRGAAMQPGGSHPAQPSPAAHLPSLHLEGTAPDHMQIGGKHPQLGCKHRGGRARVRVSRCARPPRPRRAPAHPRRWTAG